MKLTPIKNNMTEVELDDKRVLFSYSTPVAVIGYHTNGDCFVYKTAKKWSKTTSRHINLFLDGKSAQEMPQDYFDKLV